MTHEQLVWPIVQTLESLKVNDSLDQDLIGENISADRLPCALRDLQSRREQLAAAIETTQALDEVRKDNGSEGPAQVSKTGTDSSIFPSKEGG